MMRDHTIQMPHGLLKSKNNRAGETDDVWRPGREGKQVAGAEERTGETGEGGGCDK